MEADNRRPRVLICDPIAQDGIDMMSKIADVEHKGKLSQDELMQIISDYDAIVVRSGTKVPAEVIDHATRLKVIGRAGSGLDTIDVAHARANDIQVVNSPDANTVAVAEHTMGLLLALARRLPRADLSLKEGKWEKKQLMGTGLAGKTLGIIGFGRIGREVAKRAQGFSMKILTNQRRSTPELESEPGIKNVDLNKLLQQSDFITLHVPLRDDTKGIIGREQLELMKESAYIINTARGGVIEEEALLDCLNEGVIAGAALDVFVKEPATNSDLAKHERVIATPHIGASTIDAQRNAAVTIAEQIVEILREAAIDNVLPLRVVPMDKIFPHESIDQKRVEKLAARIEKDGMLQNPTIVTEVEGKYMVLDGATRTAAFKELGYPHTVVQISNPEDGLGLRTWFHVIQNIDPDTLLAILEELDEITLVETTVDKAADDMFAYGSLCYIHTVDGQVHLIQSVSGVNRLDALNHLTETYINASITDRTLKNDIVELHKDYPDLSAVVIFPEYTVSQVMNVTLSGRYFPAGITRFLIPGRILRLNADLNILKSSDMSLVEKNKWLTKLLEEKMSRNAIRYYAEPVYLLDE